MGVKAEKNFLPIQPREFEAASAHTDLLKSWLDFKLNTNLEVGINKFAKWYIEYYKKIRKNIFKKEINSEYFSKKIYHLNILIGLHYFCIMIFKIAYLG